MLVFTYYIGPFINFINTKPLIFYLNHLISYFVSLVEGLKPSIHHYYLPLS